MTDIRDAFQFVWHDNVLVIATAGNVESVRWDLIEQAAEIIMQPLMEQDVPMVVFDLSDVNYFGSVFLQLLLRCHTVIKRHGGELVLAGVSSAAAELLRVTALDTLWAIYDTRDEAIDALDG